MNFLLQNERLQEEQKHYMELLLKQYKEFEKKLAMEREVEKDEVIEVMMEKWACQRQEEKDVAGEFLLTHNGIKNMLTGVHK